MNPESAYSPEIQNQILFTYLPTKRPKKEAEYERKTCFDLYLEILFAQKWRRESRKAASTLDKAQPVSPNIRSYW
jgi:hypothetical protein